MALDKSLELAALGATVAIPLADIYRWTHGGRS